MWAAVGFRRTGISLLLFRAGIFGFHDPLRKAVKVEAAGKNGLSDNIASFGVGKIKIAIAVVLNLKGKMSNGFVHCFACKARSVGGVFHR